MPRDHASLKITIWVIYLALSVDKAWPKILFQKHQDSKEYKNARARVPADDDIESASFCF